MHAQSSVWIEAYTCKDLCKYYLFAPSGYLFFFLQQQQMAPASGVWHLRWGIYMCRLKAVYMVIETYLLNPVQNFTEGWGVNQTLEISIPWKSPFLLWGNWQILHQMLVLVWPYSSRKDTLFCYENDWLYMCICFNKNCGSICLLHSLFFVRFVLTVGANPKESGVGMYLGSSHHS